MESYAKMIHNVYNQKKESVNGYILKALSDTVFYYENEKTHECVFAIRGMRPTRSEDITAVTSLIHNGLANTTRYKRDLHFIKSYNHREPANTIFVGHSLSGAICDQLISDGIARKAITFNPAVQPKDIRNNGNTRYYNPNDFLYLLIGRYTSHHHVIGTNFSLPIPQFTVFSLWTFHRIQNFIPDYKPSEKLEEKASEHKVQAVHLYKSYFKSIADATEWIRKHQYKPIHVDETSNEYRFRLLDPAIIKTGHYDVKTVKFKSEHKKHEEIGDLIVLYKE